MTIEIRDNWSLSVLPLPKETMPAKAQGAKLPSSVSREPIIEVKRVGPESESYTEPGSVIDIYA